MGVISSLWQQILDKYPHAWVYWNPRQTAWRVYFDVGNPGPVCGTKLEAIRSAVNLLT